MRKAIVFALGLLLVTGGCRLDSGIRLPFIRPSPTSTGISDPQRAIVHRTVVEPYAKAVRTGQAAEIESLLHPDVGESERRDVFDPVSGAQGFRLRKVTMRTKPDVVPITGSSAFIDVDGRYVVDGLESQLNFRAKMSVKKSAGKWRIAGMNWTNPPPWIVGGPFFRSQAGRSVVVHTGDFSVGDLVPLIDQARVRLSQTSVPDADGHLISVPANSDDFHRIGGGSGAAVVITYYEWNGREFSVKAPFLLVNPQEFIRASASHRKLLVLHEMTHLGLAQKTTPFVPAWLSEGLAMHFSEDLPLEVFEEDRSRVDLISLPDLTRSLDLGGHDLLGEQATIDYAFSAATVAVLIEQHGEPAVLEFLSSYRNVFTVSEIEDRIPIFSTGGVASRLTLADLGVEATDRLLQKNFSTSTEELDPIVKAWIRARI